MRVRCDSMHSLQSYKDARYEWETTEPWKNGDFNERPLDGRRKKHMTIRIGAAEEVICKLYHTDVVTYYPDGIIELVSYSTGSTDEFANTLLPSGIRTSFTKNMVLLNGQGWWTSGPATRVYQTNRHFRVKQNPDGMWVPVEGQEIEPFEKLVVNRKRAKEALAKYNFADFQAWVIGYDGMNQKDSLEGRGLNYLMRDMSLVDFMAGGPAVWLEYQWRRDMEPGWGRTRWGIRNMADTCVQPQIEHIRKLIYRAERCIDKVEVPYFTSWEEWLNAEKTKKAYPWI